MDYVYIFLFILVLVLLLVGLNKLDAGSKKKYKREAYKVLEDTGNDPKKIKDTIKSLRLYSGRWRKDKESVQLVERLQEKLGDEIKPNV
jgi:hypothetical protein